MSRSQDDYPPSPDSGCRLRAAISDDVDITYEFEADYIREIEPESYDHWARQAHGIRASFLDSVGRARIVDCCNSPVGYYYWTLEDSEIGNLASVYIAKPKRRRGLGRWLMECFEVDVLRHELSTATLQVRSHNPARFLYFKLGYSLTTDEDKPQLEMRKSLLTDHVNDNALPDRD